MSQIYIWTDSTTVLKYLHNDHIRFKTFVANRVSQIRENSEDVCWMYVSTKDNPADDATRGRQTSRWSEGPAFLSQNEEVWPVQPQISKEDISNLEIKKVLKTEVKAIQTDTVDPVSIRKLKPMLLNGILRVGGRLVNLELPLDMKYPIILPHEHHVTSLIIQHYHMRVGHMGRRFKSPTITQEMAALPVDRANVNQKPFFVTGVDCFGPFFVKRARSQIKRYGILFTCLSIRAIHLEVLHDLTAESVINAFIRFISRRGTVSKLISDHGTNFIGANKVLKDNLTMRHIGTELAKRGVDWVFTPPGGSHHGGVFERMIGVVRRVLEVVIGSQTLSDDSLSTFFCEVESTINSRPLTVISNDVNDLCPITPNSLLNLDNYVVTLDSQEILCESRKKWRQVQYLAKEFWRRWQKEYLPCLQERQKWLKVNRNLKEGDIVLMVENNTPRSHWLLARVVRVMKNKDGLIRQVEIARGKRLYKRPISKLLLLLEDGICSDVLLKAMCEVLVALQHISRGIAAISSRTRIFNSSKLCGRLLNTFSFRYPNRKKSQMLKSVFQHRKITLRVDGDRSSILLKEIRPNYPRFGNCTLNSNFRGIGRSLVKFSCVVFSPIATILLIHDSRKVEMGLVTAEKS
ncbi:uncharacterized protein LOC143039035 [Oratosquilla oratoria]|uniref:uncharacterized protein LOC143039035 n=1 Tax=Oratosquilla oratoria TaxID=337810 RepID=UPI003F75AA87